jgi:hypothetical protein
MRPRFKTITKALLASVVKANGQSFSGKKKIDTLLER